MTNKPATFKEDTASTDSAVSQGLLVQLCTSVCEQKSLLKNMLDMKFSQQSTSNSTAHPENESMQNIIWKNTSNASATQRGKHRIPTSSLNAAWFWCSIQQPCWEGEKPSSRWEARGQGAVHTHVLLLRDSPLEFRGSRFPSMMIICDCVEEPLGSLQRQAGLEGWRETSS